MRPGRVVWLLLGLAVVFAACGDGGSDNLSTDASVEAGEDVVTEDHDEAAGEQPSIPPEEGGAATGEPAIPPEEGGPPPSAAPNRSAPPPASPVNVAPSPRNPGAVPAVPPASAIAPVPPSPGNAGTVVEPATTTSTTSTTLAAASPAPLHESGVYGRVTSGAGGAPLAGATVEASSNDQPSALLAAVTDADGRYAWPLDAGTWQISVSAPGHRTASRTVVVRPGPGARVDFALERG